MKNLRFTVMVLAAVLLLGGCGGIFKNKNDNKPSSSVEESAPEEEGPELIDQEEADAFLEEKLSGMDCRAVFSELKDVDGVSCYLYTVVNKNDEESEDMLGVNAVSGEVTVYDPDEDKLLPFEKFEYYKDDGSGPVSWEGKFYLEPRTVELNPADDSSFEFSIIKDGEKEPELEGVAQADPKDSHEAVYEDAEVSLTFVNKGDSLEIRDNGNISGVAGIYGVVD